MTSTTIRDLRVPLGTDTSGLRALVAKHQGVGADELGSIRVVRKVIDARSKSNAPRLILNVEVHPIGETPPPLWSGPNFGATRTMEPNKRPVIIGAGPAGLFAALRLLEHGIRPIILERGGCVEDRGPKVAQFKRKGILDEESNYCFGEGGAGTFSDGKLYTRKHHPLVRTVLEWLVSFGAPEFETLVEARPHVGTNLLIPLLKRLRATLLNHGAEIRFNTAMEDFVFENGPHGARVRGIKLRDGSTLDSDSVILATGHSARQIYRTLAGHGVHMESKGMAIGFRVEHPQDIIDKAQFGRFMTEPELGAASYRLSCQVDGRGVYSFCMCPGGFVIPTPASSGRLNVNGMSNANRKGPFANSAVVVTVDASDYAKHTDRDAEDPLSGIDFQDQLEFACFELGGKNYHAPAQKIPDFLRGRVGDLPSKTSFRPGWIPTDLNQIVPVDLRPHLNGALVNFGRKIRGFDSEQAVAIGLETTTSAPLRILRDREHLQSVNTEGLYPCGEGAGYGGGIVSCAVDGIRVADALAGATGSTQVGS